MLGKYDGRGRLILARNETAARKFVAEHRQYRGCKYVGSRAATLGVDVAEVIVTPGAHQHRLHRELLHLCMRLPSVPGKGLKLTLYESF